MAEMKVADSQEKGLLVAEKLVVAARKWKKGFVAAVEW